MNLRGLHNSVKRNKLSMYEHLKSFLIREILDFLHEAMHTRAIDLPGSGNCQIKSFSCGVCSILSLIWSTDWCTRAFGSMNVSSSAVKRASMLQWAWNRRAV